MASKRKTKKKAEKVSVVDEHKSIIDCAVDMGRFVDYYDEYDVSVHHYFMQLKYKFVFVR